MTHQYHSNGKLLLTGEYLVLQGAESLALPLKKGQTLSVKPIAENNKLIWNSIYEGNTFLDIEFSTSNLEILQTNNEKLAGFIQTLLNKAMDHMPALPRIPSCHLKATLDFPMEWGLGSSSTLITNLADWFNINPFKLNREITGGSGYDIACAMSESPILYKMANKYPEYQKINLNPPYAEHIYFLYTGRKQSSASEVERFKSENKDHSQLFPKLKEINEQIIHSRTLGEFEKAILNHEKLIASVLGQRTLQESSFPDYKGVTKSLGAWGGDFILVTWEGDKKELLKYFAPYHMDVVFTWNELVKNKYHE